jgi:hypothetical protein
MVNLKRATTTICICVLALTGSASADVISDVQSDARPLGLDIIGPVMQSGSDITSASFNANVLPALTAFKDVNLAEARQIVPDGPVQPAPRNIAVTEPTVVRAYFVSEVAAYHNAFGFNATGQGVQSGNPLLVFPDASTRSGGRTQSQPLKPGDFVDLGIFQAGTSLDLFLVRDGDRGGDVWSMDPTRNSDGVAHAFTYQPSGHPDVLMVGWEDLVGGGDRDYNDVLVALQFTPAPTNTSIPEPASLALLALSGLMIAGRPRNSRST